MPTIRAPRQSANGPRSRSSFSASSSFPASVCRMLFAALILALAFYAGIVVGMTHAVGTSSGRANHNTEACPPCTDTASSQAQHQQGATDAQIESIVEKRVEVGKLFSCKICFVVRLPGSPTCLVPPKIYVHVCATSINADHASPLALSLLQNSHDGRSKMGAGA